MDTSKLLLFRWNKLRGYSVGCQIFCIYREEVFLYIFGWWNFCNFHHCFFIYLLFLCGCRQENNIRLYLCPGLSIILVWQSTYFFIQIHFFSSKIRIYCDRAKSFYTRDRQFLWSDGKWEEYHWKHCCLWWNSIFSYSRRVLFYCQWNNFVQDGCALLIWEYFILWLNFSW